MNRDKLKYNKMNYNKFECANTNYGKINYNKMNLFCENFDMNYVLDELKKNFDKRKHLMYILRELNIKKKLTEYKIDRFIKKYTGKFKTKSILHKQISEIYKEKCKIEICIKNKKNSMLNFNVAIGHIAFFDYKENILLENVTITQMRKSFLGFLFS
ncbi:hypothetical protein MKS88_001996 [Plasmodium brasilianum]|uniref:Uncharacterized protein n=1 Tax=Plasmodium brasilianum TaxID=5824 RepID=A0ACB9YB61_PLABR|nr:hypothetical protein MKS88_001996 [Plasmodium brasilianum]